MQMLTKFESKSNRVKGLAFHPTRPLLAASLHNGTVQLWNYQMGTLMDRFDEHDGPVRAVALHPTRPLLVTGGDDYKVKVWDIRPQNRRCLFTLHGHLDYLRTVQFHHEMPWILSSSDDQTIRIWNSTSRQCIAILTGHSHYVMCAQFHPKEDLIVSASMDQTVRVWDISGLRRSTPNQQQQNSFDSFEAFSTVKYVLEGHDRGVNWASFHPTLPLIVSAADDRQIKLWRMSDTKAWEVDTCRGHFNNVSSALFHPKHELILSAGEDKTIRVWDMSKRTAVQTFRREHDRFWALCAHPELNLFAAGHDNGLIVFKLERERPAFALHGDTLYYIRDKYVRQHDLSTGSDVGVLSVRKLGNQYIQPRTLSFNPAERAVLVTSTADNGIYELASLPKDAGGELRDSTTDGKRGQGSSAIFVARNRFAILDKTAQTIEIRDLNNTLTKTIKPPVQTNEIFYGGTASLLLSSPTSVVLFDIQQQKVLAELSTQVVKYAVWSSDGANVALLGKHTITIANKTLTQSSLIHETIRIKSGAWDDSGVFIYSTLNHIKYALPQGDNGIIKTLDQPIYLTRIKGKTIHCLDRSARPRTIMIDPTEYRFKLALLRNNYDEVLHIIRTSNLVGQSIISYLQKKGFPEIALHFVQDKNTRFELAIECGNLDVALETAITLNRPESWNRLAQQALKQGNHKIVETAYQRVRNFDRLSFLYMATGATEKLVKMSKIAEARGDQMSKFHNSLYTGDVVSRVNTLRDVGLFPLAYMTAKTNGLEDMANDILDAAGLTEADLEDVPTFATSTLKPPPVITMTEQLQWPSLGGADNFFERALVEGRLADGGAPYVNGNDAAAASAALDEWEGDNTVPAADQGDEEGWGLDEEIIPTVDEVEEEELQDVLADSAPGISEADLWVRNSPVAADHVAAGSFDTAMQLLNRQVGIVNFEPLKPLFLSIYRSSYAYLTANASMPPIQIPLRRQTASSKPSQVLPIISQTLQSITSGDLQSAYRAVRSNELGEAAKLFRSILHSLLLVVVASQAEVKELQDVISSCREYLLGVSIELERRRLVQEDPDNVRRSLELAAYFTHCKLQPAHHTIALRNAMTVFTKAQNFATAAVFARKLIELNPAPKVLASARSVVTAGDRNSRDAVDFSYDQFTEFSICAASYTPIYKGSPSVSDPYTGARYLPQYKGQLDPLLQLTQIGAPASGLVSFV
ncbi:Coatomer, alpha subunit [Calocera cornea HHB12733]|uniref:Coatomer subunit alpha n=1 Tax=Calocera cornea HHB12733 TaxID=1353952 RepID=A0A165ISE8_9BASI|nr:Coatomer, alpha subunit [Calocera cornea HHB12733]